MPSGSAVMPATSTPTVPVARLRLTTPPCHATYAVVPSGVIPIPVGSIGSGIGVPMVLVAVSIGVTLAALGLTAYTVDPSGVIAMAKSDSYAEGLTTVIGVPTVLAARSIGVTVPAPASAT